MEFGLVAKGIPLGMIAVLFAPAKVETGGLDMSLFAGADPNVSPGRGNDQAPDAVELLFFPDQPAVKTIREPFSFF
jgi:hypothetical protein